MHTYHMCFFLNFSKQINAETFKTFQNDFKNKFSDILMISLIIFFRIFPSCMYV
jgi:hypothetical protein